MTPTLNPAAPHHLPIFIVAPGETDVLMVIMAIFLVLAASMGVLIPMTMLRYGRDPALGSSVMITAVTDSGGFFIFLGLATLFLVR